MNQITSCLLSLLIFQYAFAQQCTFTPWASDIPAGSDSSNGLAISGNTLAYVLPTQETKVVLIGEMGAAVDLASFEDVKDVAVADNGRIIALAVNTVLPTDDSIFAQLEDGAEVVRVYRVADDGSTAQVGPDIDIITKNVNVLTISGDGTLLGIRSNDPDAFIGGTLRTYELQENSWMQVGDGIDDVVEVALSKDASRIAVTFIEPDRVSIYTRNSNDWVLEAGLTEHPTGAEFLPEGFGTSLALNADGSILAVGAWQGLNSDSIATGVAYIYQRTSDGGDASWTERATLFEDPDATPIQYDFFGYSIGISDSGRALVVSKVPDITTGQTKGSAYVFVSTGGTFSEWKFVGSVTGDNQDDQLGNFVVMNDAGTLIAARSAIFQDANYIRGAAMQCDDATVHQVYSSVQETMPPTAGPTPVPPVESPTLAPTTQSPTQMSIPSPTGVPTVGTHEPSKGPTEAPNTGTTPGPVATMTTVPTSGTTPAPVVSTSAPVSERMTPAPVTLSTMAPIAPPTATSAPVASENREAPTSATFGYEITGLFGLALVSAFFY